MRLEDKRKKIISPLVANSLPQTIKGDYDTSISSTSGRSIFSDFIQAYYEFLEREIPTSIEVFKNSSLNRYKNSSLLSLDSQTGGPYNILNRIPSLRDFNQTMDSLVSVLSSEYLNNIPDAIEGNLNNLIKIIRDINLSKGTEAAYKALFRFIWNANVSVSDNASEIFRPSANTYRSEKVLRIKLLGGSDNTSQNNLSLFKNNYAVGSDSGAKILISNITTFSSNNITITELSVDESTLSGDFLTTESVYAQSPTGDNILIPGKTNEYVTGKIVPGVVDISIDNRGMGYIPGDKIEIVSDTGSGAEIIVNSVTSGPVELLWEVGGSLHTPMPKVGGALSVAKHRLSFSAGYIDIYSGEETIATTIGSKVNTIERNSSGWIRSSSNITEKDKTYTNVSTTGAGKGDLKISFDTNWRGAAAYPGEVSLYAMTDFPTSNHWPDGTYNGVTDTGTNGTTKAKFNVTVANTDYGVSKSTILGAGYAVNDTIKLEYPGTHSSGINDIELTVTEIKTGPSITDAGTGYSVNDIVYPVFPSFNSNDMPGFKVTSVDSSGVPEWTTSDLYPLTQNKSYPIKASKNVNYIHEFSSVNVNEYGHYTGGIENFQSSTPGTAWSNGVYVITPSGTSNQSARITLTVTAGPTYSYSVTEPGSGWSVNHTFTLSHPSGGSDIACTVSSIKVPNITNQVNGDTDTITIGDHGYETGERLRYDILPVGRPFSNSSVAYKKTFVNALNESPWWGVYSSTYGGNDSIYIKDHGFSANDKVKYTKISGPDLTGLTSGNTYYILVVDDNNVQLSTSSGGTRVAITGIGTSAGSYKLERSGIYFRGHGYSTNDTVTLNLVSGTILTGFTSGNSYVVDKIDDNWFNLKPSGGSVIEAYDVGTTSVYELTDTKGSIGLTTGNTYYAVKTNNNEFKLSATYSDSISSSPTAINITKSTDTSHHRFTRFTTGLSKIHATANVLVRAIPMDYSSEVTNGRVEKVWRVFYDDLTGKFEVGDNFRVSTLYGKIINVHDYSNRPEAIYTKDIVYIDDSNLNTNGTIDPGSNPNFSVSNGDKVVWNVYKDNADNDISYPNAYFDNTGSPSHVFGPPELISGKAYFVVDVSGDTFKLSNTSGGTAITFTGVGNGKYAYSKEITSLSVLDGGANFKIAPQPYIHWDTLIHERNDTSYQTTYSRIRSYGSKIGGINSVKILDPGVDYRDIDAIQFPAKCTSGSITNMVFLNVGRSNGLENQIASGSLKFGALLTKSSDFEDNIGFMDTSQRLPDYNTYQPYSYTIETTVHPDNFRDLVKVLLHPAGMRMLSKYVIEEKKTQTISAKQKFY